MLKKLVVGVSLIAVILIAISALSGGTAAAQDSATAGSMTVDHTAVQPESCATCHKDAGDKHQAAYDQLYQDGVIKVSDIAYAFAAPDTSTVTFKVTKNGQPIDGRKVTNLNIYWTPYTDGKFQFEPAKERLSLKGQLSYDGAGTVTSVMTGTTDMSGVAGILVIFGRDEDMGRLPARVFQTKYPFAAIMQTGAGIDYVSAANNDGCVKCHTDPYLKHGYIYAQVDGDPATDFVTCKACHTDNGEGGHFEWQLLVSDPATAAAYLAGEVELTPEQQEQYAYNTTLMNDVHMSHAMEFPYPQSIANCSTCHAGKLDTTLSDENFTGATCKSCHPVSATEGTTSPAPTLESIMPGRVHADEDLNTSVCSECHTEGEDAPTFREIHSGYDETIFTADGMKYSDAISVTINAVSFDGAVLDIQFSAGESPDIADLDATTITPTVMVGLYGYDTKDFVVGAHERLTDDNADGTIDRSDQRALEYVVGTENPRMATVAAGGGSWEVTADLSQWADLIAAGTVKRVEIAVMPALYNADGEMVALNAPSRTFDLGANAFADDFYAPIAKVADGCNNCHEALATNFHEPDRGGNIVVCRMCHITKSGGSHLEMQSRSIDSYVHAIHSGQAFDIAEIDFADPVQKMHYEHHIEFPYPNHGTTNCESCHVEGSYNVPDQSMSLPGVLSASATLTNWDRKIGTVPEVVTGPAARACGGCHRAELINEDAVGELISLNQHMKQGGYAIPTGEDTQGTLQWAIDGIMSLFQ